MTLCNLSYHMANYLKLFRGTPGGMEPIEDSSVRLAESLPSAMNVPYNMQLQWNTGCLLWLRLDSSGVLLANAQHELIVHHRTHGLRILHKI